MKHKQWKRWTAALAAAAILFTPLASRAQTPDTPTTVVNHAIGAKATANENETDYWDASKAVDGIVNRDQENKQDQSRWSTKGAKDFNSVETKNKILTVDLGSVKSFDQLVLEWERTNITQFKIETAGANEKYTTFYEKSDSAEIDSVTTTIDKEGSAQYLRLTVYGYTAGDIAWASVSLWEFEVLETVPAQNLARLDGVTASADSQETADFPAAKAIDGTVDRDGDHQSRWASAVDKDGTNPQRWLALQFQSQQTVGTVVIEWERRNATQYQLQYKTSNDQADWTTAKSFTQAPADLRDVIVLDTPIQATQLRVLITESDAAKDMDPNQSWDNVSIYEFEVYAQTLDQGEDTPTQPGNDKPVVIPELAEWTGGQGNFTITNDTKLVVNPTYKDNLSTAVTEFQADYKDVTGKTLTVEESTNPAAHDFYFTLGSNDAELGEEGYLLKVTDSLTVEAVKAQGVYWGTRSILQILTQTGDSIPQGTARDYPLYEVRGFMLDVGRKPISYEFLQSIVKEMAWYKMNDFQIHLNDNAFQQEYPNASTNVEVAKNAYSGFRLESTIKAGGLDGLYKADLTSEDMYYTKDQMRTLIQDARTLGIDIVPEIDTPAHSLALTKVRPDLIYKPSATGVDHLNLHEKYDETLSFVKSIFNEYMTGNDPVFDQQTIVHVGTDEYDATYKEAFRKYTDAMLGYVQDTGRTVRLWGSLTMRDGNTNVRSKDVQMNIWNTGWANPQKMYEAGYDLINTQDTYLYIVPGVTRAANPYYHDYLDSKWLYENWVPNKMGNTTIPADDDQMLGATFAVWNDKSGVHSNGITEQDIYDRFADALPALASKMWGKGEDLTYQQLVAAADTIGVAPNDNPTFQATSVNGEYLTYTFEDGQEKEDVTANNRDITNLHNVSTQYGTLELQGEDSYVTTGLDKLGFGNTLEFDVTLSEEAQPGQILFEADSEYDTHDIRILSDGTLGYTTELYDYSFDYKLPVGKTVHLKIESAREHSALIVDGVRHEAVGSYSEEATGLNLTDIGYPSFVLPLQRIGSETNAVKAFIDNVTVYATPQEESKIASVESSSEYTDNPITNAFDGSTSTFWHSNWNPYEALPATVTINLDGQQTVTGFTYLPRQDGNNNGQVTKYSLEYQATADGEWLPLVTDGTWAANTQEKTAAAFEPVQAVALRFTAKNGTGDNSHPAYACAAEFKVLFDTSGSVELDMKAYADPAQGGTATVSPQTATAGQTVTFTAQAAEDYHFTGWYNLVGEKVSDQATYAVKADSCLTLIAKFSNEAPHTHTVTLVKGTPATCTQDGVKDYYWCSCGVAFEDEAMTKPIQDLDTWKVIPATGHSYGQPTFQWAEDGKTANAVFTCTAGDDEQTVPATITSQVTTEATCTAMGVTTYTATVEFGKHTYTATKAVTDIPMEDHQYVDGVCTVCGAKDPDYVEPTQKPEPTEEPTTQPTQEPQVTQTPDTTQQPQATDKPAATQQPDTVPPTGDNAPLVLSTVLLMGAAVCLLFAIAQMRKQRR